MDRRSVLGLAAGLASGSAHAAYLDGPTPAALMIAGPAGGRLDRWGDLLAVKLGRHMPARAPLTRQNVGGLDGVTGANQFDVRGEPDGSVALLVPGSASLSWLVGEARAKFDPGRWVPLWAGAAPSVLVSRIPAVPGRPLRVAAENPAGLELAAFLALDLMGVDGQPVGTTSPDAVLLRGSDLGAALQTAASSGMQPIMAYGSIGADGGLGREPILRDVPTVLELVGPRQPASMLAALRAAALVAQLDAGLVLPQLTPAASVAMWRSACGTLQSDAEVTAEVARLGIRLVPASAAADCTSQIGRDPDLLLTLRRWLGTRYDWRPT